MKASRSLPSHRPGAGPVPSSAAGWGHRAAPRSSARLGRRGADGRDQVHQKLGRLTVRLVQRRPGAGRPIVSAQALTGCSFRASGPDQWQRVRRPGPIAGSPLPAHEIRRSRGRYSLVRKTDNPGHGAGGVSTGRSPSEGDCLAASGGDACCERRTGACLDPPRTLSPAEGQNWLAPPEEWGFAGGYRVAGKGSRSRPHMHVVRANEPGVLRILAPGVRDCPFLSRQEKTRTTPGRLDPRHGGPVRNPACGVVPRAFGINSGGTPAPSAA